VSLIQPTRQNPEKTDNTAKVASGSQNSNHMKAGKTPAFFGGAQFMRGRGIAAVQGWRFISPIKGISVMFSLLLAHSQNFTDILRSSFPGFGR
jgi:hypothetical protein